MTHRTSTPTPHQTANALPAVLVSASTLWLGESNNSASSAPRRCSLPPRKGPCLQEIRRWYYDPIDHSCKAFIFGGCSANSNNYKTRSQCESNCLEQQNVNTAASGAQGKQEIGQKFRLV